MIPIFTLHGLLVLFLLAYLTTYSLAQEAAGPDESVKKSAQLALDEDDFQTVIVENKLGCNIYLKKLEENSDMINLLPDNDLATLWIPPPRYSDRLNVSDESREPRCYVGIQIVEAKVVIYLLRLSVDLSLYFLINK